MKIIAPVRSILFSILEDRRFIPGLAIVGTLARLALIAYMNRSGSLHFYDEFNYDHIATSLAHGDGFIQWGTNYSAYRAPAEPIFLALLYRVFGHFPVYAHILQALLLAIIPFVCARIGQALGLSTAGANAGAMLATFHPGLTYAAATLYPSVLTVCGLTLGVWLCSRLMNRSSLGESVGAGLSLGLAGSATTTFAPVAVLAALVLTYRRSYRSAMVVGVLGTLPVLVWMVRNEIVLGKFTVATNGGYNLYLGANDDATPLSGNWVHPELPHEYDRGEIAVDADYQARARQWIHAHPARWTRLAVERGVLVFDSEGNPKTQGLHSGLLGHLAGWVMLPIMLLGIVGLCLGYKQPLTWLTAVALSLVVVSSAATIVKPRFRFPCDPLLCEFAVAGLLGLQARVRTLSSLEPAREPQMTASASKA